MADSKTTKTAEEYQTLLKKGMTAVKNAQARITELEGDLANANAAAKARDEQVKAAKALGPEIVDRLIKAGQFMESDREKCIAAMADPVKVAQELGNVLARQMDIPTMGTPEGEVGDKKAGLANPMQSVDDAYRQRCNMM